MIMADVFKILFLILGAILCTISYWLMFQALFASAVEHCRRTTLEHPYRVFLTGIVGGLPLLVVGLALLNTGAGPVKFIGAAILVAVTTASLFGSTGIIHHVGAQLAAEPRALSSGLTILRGGAVVAIACVFPVVGWFLLLPIVLITGFGATLRHLCARPARGTATAPATVAQA